MRYRVAVYFDGPRSQWGEQLHPEEIIYQCDVPWLWLARTLAKGNVGNTGRCSYVINSGERIVEQFDAERP